MDELTLLARPKWVGVEEAHPLIGDLDLLLLILAVDHLEPCRVGIHDELRDLLGEDGVGDVPEVGLVAASSLGIRVREVGLQLSSLDEHRVHDLYRELVVVRHLDVLHLGLR